MFSFDCLSALGVRVVEVFDKLTVLDSCSLFCIAFQYLVMCFKIFFILIGVYLAFIFIFVKLETADTSL